MKIHLFFSTIDDMIYYLNSKTVYSMLDYHDSLTQTIFNFSIFLLSLSSSQPSNLNLQSIFCFKHLVPKMSAIICYYL